MSREDTRRASTKHHPVPAPAAPAVGCAAPSHRRTLPPCPRARPLAAVLAALPSRLMISLLYNALLLVAVALVVLRARRLRAVPWGSLLALATAALFLAAILGEDPFGVLRLLAYAVFAQAPLAAIALALVLRKDAPKTAALSAVLGLILLGIAADAFLIEPRMLEISRVSLTTTKLTRPVRIAVVADLQMDSFGDHEREALAAVLRERPDLILMPGDYIQADDHAAYEAARGALAAYLRAIDFRAPLGVYAVEGNVDGPAWTEIFAGLPITVFPATNTVVHDDIAVTGLTLGDSFDRGILVPAAPRFHIAVGHAPDFSLGRVEADLLVAGHTHGGQVRLPFVGPLITLSAVPRSHAAGTTHLAGGRTLVVSRGIGMERHNAPRLRFLCRPEIVIIDVAPTSAPPARGAETTQ
jgi:uncharacterized protein